MEYESVIGLEVHAQLLTQSKLFCSCATVFQADPNEQTCSVCLGMPGVLSVLNRQAAEKLRAALHTGAPEARVMLSEDRQQTGSGYLYPRLGIDMLSSVERTYVMQFGWLTL